VLLCLPHVDAVDSDRQAFSANCLSRERQYALEHGHAEGQIAVEIKVRGEKIGWLYGNKLGDGQRAHGLEAVKADWNAI
jgi:hypothetical protein